MGHRTKVKPRKTPRRRKDEFSVSSSSPEGMEISSRMIPAFLKKTYDMGEFLSLSLASLLGHFGARCHGDCFGSPYWTLLLLVNQIFLIFVRGCMSLWVMMRTAPGTPSPAPVYLN